MKPEFLKIFYVPVTKNPREELFLLGHNKTEMYICTQTHTHAENDSKLYPLDYIHMPLLVSSLWGHFSCSNRILLSPLTGWCWSSPYLFSHACCSQLLSGISLQRMPIPNTWQCGSVNTSSQHISCWDWGCTE